VAGSVFYPQFETIVRRVNGGMRIDVMRVLKTIPIGVGTGGS